MDIQINDLHMAKAIFFNIEAGKEFKDMVLEKNISTGYQST